MRVVLDFWWHNFWQSNAPFWLWNFHFKSFCPQLLLHVLKMCRCSCYDMKTCTRFGIFHPIILTVMALFDLEFPFSQLVFATGYIFVGFFIRTEIVASSMLSLTMQTHTLFEPLWYSIKILWCRCCKDDEISTSLWSLMDGCFSTPSAFLWELIVLLCLPTCFYTRIRQILYMVAWKQAKQIVFTNDSISIYRYIDIWSLNSKFSEYLEFIFPRELEIKETSDSLFLILRFILIYRQWKTHYWA